MAFNMKFISGIDNIDSNIYRYSIYLKTVTGVLEAIVGQSNLTRFYSVHTFVLPLLINVFILMHFLMIR
ncbi:hypothetical protein ES332_D11G351300v1 [Gossypium tomentosum]|uniref:Cytochrome b/b6 N-terminal region profile domain-containing protein n=1 Tax=Gossypium tomentosum TaxID=34277 RepID=A0A5D2IW28_GOSTO|nr:hypothetical protein ES332_D11G351300v1 [Gossypium tomentosum]